MFILVSKTPCYREVDMKKVQWLLTAAIMCVSSTFVACSNNDGSSLSDKKPLVVNLSEKIVGKWMLVETDGVPVLTNQKSVHTFVAEDSTIKAYNSMAMNDVGSWWEYRKKMDVFIDGNRVTVKGTYDNGKSVITEMNVTSVVGKEMQFEAKTTLFSDGEAYAVIGPRHEKYIRVDKDYSQEILGTWEGHVTSDQSAYDDHKQHRWEYKDDGTYSYMGLTEDGQWEDDVNSTAEYFVDGSLLCTRWKNVGDPTEHREWWEITSITDGVMNWAALRRSEQDSVYTATFSMRRVQEP